MLTPALFLILFNSPSNTNILPDTSNTECITIICNGRPKVLPHDLYIPVTGAAQDVHMHYGGA